MADKNENMAPNEIESNFTEELSESELNDVSGGHATGGGGGAGKVSMQDIHFTSPQTNQILGDGSVKPGSDILV